IMAVGDDAQSIYSFRGANFENILFFPASFKNCSIYKIEQNYRSDSRIIDLANNIINSSPFKYEKKLFSEISTGNIPMIISTENDTIQAHFVIESISNLVNEGKKLSDIAVLYRTNNSSMELELLLSEKGIPYQKFGGLKFLETAHINDLLSFIKVLHNQSDIISWNRLLKMFPGIGNSKTEKIIGLLTNNANVNELANIIGKLAQKAEIENFLTIYFKYINQLELFKDYLKEIGICI